MKDLVTLGSVSSIIVGRHWMMLLKKILGVNRQVSKQEENTY